MEEFEDLGPKIEDFTLCGEKEARDTKRVLHKTKRDCPQKNSRAVAFAAFSFWIFLSRSSSPTMTDEEAFKPLKFQLFLIEFRNLALLD
jgi:hypothetical protein